MAFTPNQALESLKAKILGLRLSHEELRPVLELLLQETGWAKESSRSFSFPDTSGGKYYLTLHWTFISLSDLDLGPFGEERVIPRDLEIQPYNFRSVSWIVTRKGEFTMNNYRWGSFDEWFERLVDFLCNPGTYAD